MNGVWCRWAFSAGHGEEHDQHRGRAPTVSQRRGSVRSQIQVTPCGSEDRQGEPERDDAFGREPPRGDADRHARRA